MKVKYNLIKYLKHPVALAILLPVATLTLKIPMLDKAWPLVNVDLF